MLSIFDLGWFGGRDSQLAFDLVALGRDWWILTYLFGGTILLGFAVIFRMRGLGGVLRRVCWVLGNLNSPDKEAINFLGGLGGPSGVRPLSLRKTAFSQLN